jgi:hypothetical protein
MERVTNHANDAVVFAASASVGLILLDNTKVDLANVGLFALGAADTPDSFISGFYTPEEARQVANALLRFADDAEASRANGRF